MEMERKPLKFMAKYNKKYLKKLKKLYNFFDNFNNKKIEIF